MNGSSINSYPLSGFSKISYDEFKGIFHILSLYSSLTEEEKRMVSLCMDGLKFRENLEDDLKDRKSNERLN